MVLFSSMYLYSFVSIVFFVIISTYYNIHDIGYYYYSYTTLLTVNNFLQYFIKTTNY